MNAVVEHKPEEKSAYERLPRRHRRFVDAYVPGISAAEALRQSGYRGSYPEVVAYKLLKRPEVRAAVEEKEAWFIEQMGVRAERIIRETLALATSDPRRLVWQEGEEIPVWTEANIPRYEAGDALPDGTQVGDIRVGYELGQPRARVGDRKALQDLDDATAAALAGVEIEEVSTGGRFGTRYKYKLWDKNKALDKLGQFRKLWDAKHQTVNVDARSVTVNTPSGAEAVQGALRLLEQVRAFTVGAAAAPGDPDGSVLPAEIRTGEK